MDRRELTELIISWLTLSIAFAWDINPITFLHSLPYFFIGVGTVFVLHELSHKYAAHYFGYPARFMLWWPGLLFSLLFAIATNGRYIFAAPGAVYVFGHPSVEEDGKISAAGPLTNLFLAYLFFFLAPLSPLFLFLSKINAMIGFFNMLPLYPLDGSKILAWNPAVFFIMLLAFLPVL